MANLVPTIGDFQAAFKVFRKEQAQQLQEANCSQHMNEKAEAFEPSDFLDLEEDFNHSCKNEDADDQAYNFNIVKTGPSIRREYADSFPSNPPCIRGLHLDHNSTVIQTHPQETMTPKKSRKRKAERALKYAFLTRSETDILEDGYKWRKYGKKFVKNSPNPRNYYRCSDSNCDVKKTVERDAHDKGIVITSYLGRHNHESPCVVYYIGKPETLQLPCRPTASPILQHISPVYSYVPESFEQHQ